MKPFITFTSDFGLKDNYVASVKAVLWSHLPEALLLDVTHEIPPYSPAYVLPHLLDIFERCPKGAIHLVVVDPGVGGHRRPLAGMSDNFFLVLADNGLPFLLSGWIQNLRFIHLSELQIFGGCASATFQGRDLFAPAVAYLANGNDPARLGPEIDVASLERKAHPIRSEKHQIPVWNVDRFGNIILGYRATRPPEGIKLRLGERDIPYVLRYQGVSSGQLGCLVNSSGWLEIFCREGSAFELTGIGVGDWVAARITGGEGRRLL